MKRRRFLLLAGILVALAASAALLPLRRPFRDLPEITAATVELLPPGDTISLSAAEIDTLTELLGDVRVSRRDGSYTEYEGQAVIFTLTLTDGTVTEVNVYSPFLILDGVGYRASHKPCQALSAFGNQLRS